MVGCPPAPTSPGGAPPDFRPPGCAPLPPFSFGPPPVWAGRFAEIIRDSAQFQPVLRVIDFVDDLRLVDVDGDRTQLSGAAKLADLHSRMSVRFHAKGASRLWLRQCIPPLGFAVNTESILVECGDGRRGKSQESCTRFMLQSPGRRFSARLNFSQWLLPGCSAI